MSRLTWTETGLDDLEWWAKHDPKKLKRIIEIGLAACRTPTTGIGKPEPLRFDFQGYWSRQTHDLKSEGPVVADERRPGGSNIGAGGEVLRDMPVPAGVGPADIQVDPRGDEVQCPVMNLGQRPLDVGRHKPSLLAAVANHGDWQLGKRAAARRLGLVPRPHLVSYTPSSSFSRPSASSIINSFSPPICSSLMNIWG